VMAVALEEPDPVTLELGGKRRRKLCAKTRCLDHGRVSFRLYNGDIQCRPGADLAWHQRTFMLQPLASKTRMWLEGLRPCAGEMVVGDGLLVRDQYGTAEQRRSIARGPRT